MEYKSQNVICQNCKTQFTIEPEDFKFYEKMKVPPPTFCPECRIIRRFIWRNERVLYKRKCELCGNIIFTLFSPVVKTPVYCYDCWWSDKWNPMIYMSSYDFSQPFLKQFQKLIEVVPIISKWGFDNINCDYAAHMGYSKNAYLSSSGVHSEDIYYSYSIDKGKNIFDSFLSGESELCYENINCNKTYNSSFLVNSKNCINSFFLYDCSGCQDCVLCTGLRNKKFYIRNKMYTESAFRDELKKINFGSNIILKKLKDEFFTLQLIAIHKYADIIASNNCTGDGIHNSKNVCSSFVVNDSENLKYCWRIPTGYKDSYDVSGSLDSELIYEAALAADHNYFLKFHIQCRSSKNLEYCMYCSLSTNCFACIGLRSKQYCILNKQYTKEEYEELVPKIIKHMNDMPYISSRKNPSTGSGQVYKYGEFFPSELSPFCYNETIAQEYFPLTKEEATEQGYKWKEKEERNYNIDIKTKDIPNDIKEVNESIINKVIECEHQGKCNEQCTEAFKIIQDEYTFYKRINLPIPLLCPNCRHYQRLKQRNPLKLWHRKCMKEGCTNEFETSYAPDRPEIVYCERCYQQEVY